MTDESVILIDEMIMPEIGTTTRQAQLDFTMATCLVAMERDEAQWKELLNAAGLKIHKTYQYTEEVRDFIIVAVRK
jgi:demethylsterigmatocystin 6-O-methyltransferase